MSPDGFNHAAENRGSGWGTAMCAMVNIYVTFCEAGLEQREGTVS